MNDETGNSSEESEVVPEEKPSNIGRIEWMDLTVDDASSVRNFYTSVVGWSSIALTCSAGKGTTNP